MSEANQIIVCIVLIIFWWIVTIIFAIIDKDLKCYLTIPLLLTIIFLLELICS